MIAFASLSVTRLRAARDAARRSDDTGAAMLLSVAFIIFVGGLMLVLLAVLLTQAAPLQTVQRDTRTGYAAQAGIQAGLSVIRSNTKVVSGETFGDPTKLPQILTGTVDGATGSTLTYSVTLQYFRSDPAGKNAAWLAANRLPWPLSSSASSQPSFVRLESTGSDGGAGSRTIAAVYSFTTTNINVPGGLIYNNGRSQCLKAVSATVGSYVNMVSSGSCTDDNLDLWVYDTDYRLKLASTLGTSTVLCVTGAPWGTRGATPSGTVRVTLRTCSTGTTNSTEGNQLWSWDTPNAWVGQNSTNTARTRRWLGVSSGQLVEWSGSGGNDFDPAPAVGAGAASINTVQIVNYREFGRCMDVTHGNIGKAYMIVYPCKQDPTGTGAALNWNHKWHYSEPVSPAVFSAAQPIWVDNGSRYCLSSSTTSQNVTFSSCTPSNPASIPNTNKFIRNNETGSALTSWTFQLASDTTKCLAAVPGVNPDGEAWSVLRLMPCDGSTAQKWNAPAVTSGSTLDDYQEIG